MKYNIFLIIFLFLPNVLFAQSSINVFGNKKYDDGYIKSFVKEKDAKTDEELNEDLKNIYKSNNFENLSIEEKSDNLLSVYVKEKPKLLNINIEASSKDSKNAKLNAYTKEDIIKKLEEELHFESGDICGEFEIKKIENFIRKLYEKKSYHNVKIKREIEKIEGKDEDCLVNLNFKISEGEKLKIQNIKFIGNKKEEPSFFKRLFFKTASKNIFCDKRLKKLMDVDEEGFFSWFSGSGDLDEEKLEEDIQKIKELYQDNGYINVQVSDYKIVMNEDKTEADIIIKINTNKRYKVGELYFEGDLIEKNEILLKSIKLEKEQWFKIKDLKESVQGLQTLYADKAFSQNKVNYSFKEKDDVLDVIFNIKKGSKVKINKIIIKGNIKTRDKVIRRLLKVYENDYYYASNLRSSYFNLYRTDYFEAVDIDIENIDDGKIDLIINVKEKTSGVFSLGGGYSSIDSFFLSSSISNRNFLGRGQTLSLNASIDANNTRYSLTFTEPWLFDIPLYLSLELYDWDQEYSDYDKHSVGFGASIGYRIFEYTRAYLSFNKEIADVQDIETEEEDPIWHYEGKNTTNSVSTKIVYDSRNHVFHPDRGNYHSFKIEYAGRDLGGDIDFNKYIFDNSKFFPCLWDTIFMIHGEAGYVEEFNKDFPLHYERFELGGMYSLRGFESSDVTVYDDNGYNIGGDKYLQFNAELLFPIAKEGGLYVLAFYDMGDVYDNSYNFFSRDLNRSYGYGFRWYSPIGPIRIERGTVLKSHFSEAKEGSSRWEFTIGVSF